MNDPELPKIIVEALSLRKRYTLDGSPIEALRGLDLTLGEGESVAVIGPSGSGKSTLLHLLGLLDLPTGGTLKFLGRDVLALNDREKAALRRSEIGFVFQFHHLLPEFSALENVMIPSLMRGQSKGEAEEQARDLISAVGLENRSRHKPGELSGGEQQRVALARALVNRPKLLLADEPTGNLDLEAAAKMKEILWRLCSDSGACVVVVTHNLSLAADAGRVLRMADGRFDGPPTAA